MNFAGAIKINELRTITLRKCDNEILSIQKEMEEFEMDSLEFDNSLVYLHFHQYDVY